MLQRRAKSAVLRALLLGTTAIGVSLISSSAQAACPAGTAGDDTCLVDSSVDQTIARDGGTQVTVDTFQLGGATNFNFDAAKIGTTYTNWEVFQKVGTANVTLFGAAGTDADWNVLAGTLSVSGGSAIFNTSSISVGASGTINLLNTETIGSLTGSAGSNVMLTGATLFTGGNNETTTFAGTLSGTGGLEKQGTGTFTLSGSNTYIGTTGISGGILALSGGSALSDSSAVVIGPSGTLQLNNSETIGSLAGVSGALVTLGANTLTTGANNTSTTFGGAISGTGGLTKVGTGAMTLNGVNTYSGPTTITGGTLRVEGEEAIANNSAVHVGTGATLELMNTEQVGALSGDAGSFINLGLYTLVAGDATNTTFAGNISGISGIIVVNIDPDLSDADPTTVPVNVPAAGGFVKTGTGTLTFSGTNTYVGETLVQQGTLILSGGSAISDVGFVSVGNGATLRLASNETIGALSGAAAITGGPPLVVSPTPAQCAANPAMPGCAGPISLDPFPSLLASTVDLQGFTLTTNGAINPALPTDFPQGSAFGGNMIGTGNLVKEGSGELVLSGQNTYTGTTTVNDGKLTLSGGLALSDVTAVTLNNDGVLNLMGSERIGSLTGGPLSSVTLGVSTLTTGDGSNTTFAGSISGSGGLTKVGTGTFSLTGSNTYTGLTTISDGKLFVSGSSAIADSSPVTIGATGILELGDDEVIGRLNGVAGSSVLLGTNDLGINATGAAANFAGVISGTGDVTKTGTGVQRFSGANTYSGATHVNGGTLELAGGSAIADTGLVDVGAAGTVSLINSETIGNLTGVAGATVNLNANTLTAGDSSNRTYGGTIIGSGSLVKTGTGALALTGTNTFSGGTFINDGTLNVGGGSALADTGAVSILSTGTLGLLGSETIGGLTGVAGSQVTLSANTLTINLGAGSADFAGIISGTGGVTKTGAGTQRLSGANTYTGLTSVSGGVLELGGGSAIADSGAVGVGGGATLKLLASETIGSLSGAPLSTVDLGSFTLTTGDASSTIFGGSITGTGGLTKQGAGSMLLSGPNTYTGTTNVNGGTLTLQNGSAIADTGAVVVASGATLQVNSSETIGSLSGVLGSSVLLNSGTLTTGDASNTTFAGDISGAGGLTKQGSGVFTLSGTNTFSGATTVAAGTLELSGGAALSDVSSVHVASGASLNLLSSETIGALTGAAGSTVGMGANSLTINATTGSSVFAGSITGSGGVTKTGGGRQVLAGSNTFTGATTINGGTLAVSGGSAISNTGSVSVASGATFEVAGSETIGTLSGVGGSSLNLASGTLTLGTAANSTFAGAVFGSGNLVKQGTGIFTLSGANTSTGTTTVNAGTLSLANGSAIGDGGAVNVGGSGTLNLVNSERIGSLSGSGAVTLGANTLTTGDASNTTFTGTFSGTGGMTKEGTGKFSTASLGYTGLTTINAGELNVNGSILGSVLINAAGTLSGTNTIAGNLTNLGTLSSGNSPGSTIVGGNYAGGGLLTVEVQLNNGGAPVNGTTHDYLQVGGDVTGSSTISIAPFAPSNAPVATTGLGYELVRVGGTVASNAFTLAGPVISGGFEYLLHYEPNYSGTTDGFFLRSAALQEIALNSALLSAGRATAALCGRADNTHPDFDGKKYRVYADVRHGSLSTGADTGSEYDAEYNCFSAGGDVAIGENFFAGVSGSYGKTDADVALAQGTAKLIGDGGRYQAHAGFVKGNFFAIAALGYAKTEWDVTKAGGGFLIADVKGQLGHLTTGYKFAWDKSTSLTMTGRLDYNGTECGGGCLISGSEETVSNWSATAAMRLDAAVFGDTIKPYVVLALSDDLDGGNVVTLGGATSVADTASMLLDADIGFDAALTSGLSMFAQGRVTHGLDTEVEGFEARGGMKLSF